MTEERQIQNVTEMGYSKTEARFLVLAALHSGYFLRRQFAPARGRSADVLCRRLLALKHATRSKYHYRAELYHLGSKPFYAMLGEVDNRHRREHDVIYLRAKLMGLDYVLTHPELQFLPTERSKVDYFCTTMGVNRMLLPGQTYKGKNGTLTKRNFVEKYPIYINPSTGIVGLCYLDDGMYTRQTFKPWLLRHRLLIQSLGAHVEIVYVASEDSGFADAAEEYRRVLTALPLDLCRFLDMRSSAEKGGLEDRPIEWLQTYRELLSRYGNHPPALPESPSAGFRTEVLPYSYKALPRIDTTTLAAPGEAFSSAQAT